MRFLSWLPKKVLKGKKKVLQEAIPAQNCQIGRLDITADFGVKTKAKSNWTYIRIGGLRNLNRPLHA